jgi:uncharacterized circularly permuted ATP-grasp superfamily protein/uncharacterized alpha-E superfamily protein
MAGSTLLPPAYPTSGDGVRPRPRSNRAPADTRYLGRVPRLLESVDDEIARLLADDGATYVAADGVPQPWRLDAEPLVLQAAEWATLGVGLAQRTELLNAVLADLYGPRRLLRRGIVPSSVVFAHVGYLRPLVRPLEHERAPLLLAATDLRRDAGGEWRVVADRTQAPSGLGYAMGNRRVLAQVRPDEYLARDVHRLAPYFAALRAMLVDAAPEGTTSPRVVVLSPGPQSETAYEQGYLANVLGFPLVQGEDLVMRDGWIWLKPAGWPKRPATQRVDVILRRVDAEWSDPLEMRGGSRLGIAGLAEAARRGRVRIVNSLGAGILENPGLVPFLPAACEELLGERLILPDAHTWWCGDPDSLRTVLERLDDPALQVRAIDETNPIRVDPAELRARILAAPHRFAAQQVPLDPVVLRTFTIRLGAAYRPLAGGLATVTAPDLDADEAPLTRDVWVRKAALTDADQGLADVPVEDAAGSIPVPSPRALEDMFWIGRYAERAEDMLRVILTLPELDDRGDRADEGTPDAVTATGARALRELLQRLADPSGRAGDELLSLLLDADREGSAAQSVRGLRLAVEGVRDQMSGDTWRAFANLDRAQRTLWGREQAVAGTARVAEAAGGMLTAVLALQGVTANMVRDAAWHMIEAGRSLERALQVVALLAETTTRVRTRRAEREVLTAALLAAESSVTYRRQHRGAARPESVLALLVSDEGNPRSIAFAIAEIRGHLVALPASTGSTRPERMIEQLAALLTRVDVAALATPDPAGMLRPGIQTLLADLSTRLEQLSEAVHGLHFSGGLPPLALSELSLVEEAS